MRLQARVAWFNRDHEGAVAPGQQFEASEYRANELTRAGLAIPVVDENKKIPVPHDPPPPDPTPAPTRQVRTLRADDPQDDKRQQRK